MWELQHGNRAKWHSWKPFNQFSYTSQTMQMKPNQAMDLFQTHLRLTWLKFWNRHHFPPYNILWSCEWGLHWNGKNSPKSQNGFAKFKYIVSQAFGASKVLQNMFILNMWNSLHYWFCQKKFKELKISWFGSDLIPQIVEIVVKCHFGSLIIN